ncbi:MAG: four helix bundle protein [Balneolaceae bacterium]|nr:MAG: four helix bundle protein [Balneolaceae bacterium]
MIFKKLSVWKKSIQLATSVYRITQNFPASERFGIISQIRRSVVSIGSNIAEASGRSGDKEFRYLLNVAYASALELETQLIISRNLDYITVPDFTLLSQNLAEIQKMLYSLAKGDARHETQDARHKT